MLCPLERRLTWIRRQHESIYNDTDCRLLILVLLEKGSRSMCTCPLVTQSRVRDKINPAHAIPRIRSQFELGRGDHATSSPDSRPRRQELRIDRKVQEPELICLMRRVMRSGLGLVVQMNYDECRRDCVGVELNIHSTPGLLVKLID
jgi:hypothetical protein